jgi:DNA repair protein RadD
MLRKYQQDAVDSLFEFQHDRPGQSSVIVIPTGGGKTRVMAEIIRRSFEANPNCRGMILSHVKELLEQSSKTCTHYATTTGLPVESIGVYSAALKRREVKPLTIAGIQSVYRKGADFGYLDFIMIDECHLISQNKETMYRKFLSQAKISNSRVKVVGLTATPYRLQSGIIFGHKEKTFDNCCYAIGVRDLIDEGFLSPLVTMGTSDSPDLKNVRIRAGEYFSKDLDAILENSDLVQSSVKEAIVKASSRKSVLVFASSIKHAEMILNELKKQGQSANMITGETHSTIRDFLINGFRANSFKWLVNVAVLTTGFDAPGIDCVVVMRPTMSKGLWYQMVGRGFRLAPDKENCLILDFGDNALRHGCIDQIVVDAQGIELPAAKVKRCPSCNLIHRIGNIICPSCGYFKPKEEESLFPEKLSASQTNGEILAGRQPKQYEIVATGYTIYRKTPASDPCILETHETLEGKLIRCYHSLKHGLEFIVWKWLKSVGAKGLPDKHWNMNKESLQIQEWLDTIPKPTAIKAHINEKGYYHIDSYSFQSNRVIGGGMAKG